MAAAARSTVTASLSCLLLAALLLAAAPGHVRGQAAASATALNAVQAVPFLATLNQAIAAANLTSLFDASFNGTLFAPNDQAFTNFARAQGLASPADLLTAPGNASLLQVLAYHVVPGVALQQRDFTNGAMLPTMLEGQQLSVSLQAAPLVHIIGSTPTNLATILGSQQVRGGRAVVHAVDTVLIPAIAS